MAIVFRFFSCFHFEGCASSDLNNGWLFGIGGAWGLLKALDALYLCVVSSFFLFPVELQENISDCLNVGYAMFFCGISVKSLA